MNNDTEIRPGQLWAVTNADFIVGLRLIVEYHTPWVYSVQCGHARRGQGILRTHDSHYHYGVMRLLEDVP